MLWTLKPLPLLIHLHSLAADFTADIKRDKGNKVSNRRVKLDYLTFSLIFSPIEIQEILRAVINSLHCVIRFRICYGNIRWKGIGMLSIV